MPGFRVVDHRQIESRLDPVGLVINLCLAPRGRRAMVVAVQPGAHGKEIIQCNGCLARVGMVIGLIAHQRQHALVDACEGATVDGDARKRADDGLGCRTELLCATRTVAIEVLFEHQFAMLVEQDAVHPFVSSVEDGAHDGASCRDSKIRLRDISDGDSVMQVGWRIVAIVEGGILAFRTGPGKRGGFRRDGCGYTRMERAILLVPGYLAACIARE